MYSEKSKRTEKLLEPITGISRVFIAKRKEFYTSAATNKIMMGLKGRDLIHQRRGKNTI